MASLPRRSPWRSSTILIVILLLAITANETQRMMAQWQSHKERQAQLYLTQANGLKLDKLVRQNALQAQLIMQRSTASDRHQCVGPGGSMPTGRLQ